MSQAAIEGQKILCINGAIIEAATQGVVSINNILVGIEGSIVSDHQNSIIEHEGKTIATATQSYISINGRNVARIGSITSCGGEVVYTKDDKAQQNFIYIN